MNASAQPRTLNVGPARRYVFNGRCYELVKAGRGYRVSIDPPRTRLVRWCGWRHSRPMDAAHAEQAFWHVITGAIARRPRLRQAIIGDAHMVIARDREGYHVAVFQPGRRHAVTCGNSWRQTIETCSVLAGELLDRQPRVPAGFGQMRW